MFEGTDSMFYISNISYKFRKNMQDSYRDHRTYAKDISQALSRSS